MKRLIVFDLDGTLAESKGEIDGEMAGLLARLLAVVRVAIVSGAAFAQFEQQFVANIPGGADLSNLSLLPTCGTRFYRYENGWRMLYAEDLSDAQKTRIVAGLKEAFERAGFEIKKTWGDPVEDRLSQITYSALGQNAPLVEKKTWDPDFAKRKIIKAIADRLLPDFSVRLGGATSIDVTLPGIDKAYGIGKLHEILGVEEREMIYVGDALFPGGNDAPVRTTAATCIQVRDPEESKRVIEAIVACLGDRGAT